jgi:hypothetical protein
MLSVDQMFMRVQGVDGGILAIEDGGNRCVELIGDPFTQVPHVSPRGIDGPEAAFRRAPCSTPLFRPALPA